LSGKQKGESSDAASSRNKTGKRVGVEKKVRKQKAGDIGRALRSIYDDTVREPVPGDFMDLLGKLR
jgi:anti-sigma factor NepR-like protein